MTTVYCGAILWGTTVIRLKGEAGNIKRFEEAKLRLVYKWYSSNQ